MSLSIYLKVLAAGEKKAQHYAEEKDELVQKFL